MAPTPPLAAAGEADTRMRVLQVLLERPHVTAPDLAEYLQLTGTAVRRHLHHLVDDGFAEPAEGVKPAGGRGRPAAAWRITPAGRSVFGHSYDELARQALVALRDAGGDAAVRRFARSRARQLLQGIDLPHIPSGPTDDSGGTVAGEGEEATEKTVLAVARAFQRHGYAVTLEHAGEGVQLCQHHCPVAQVARDFPELCDAEAEAIAAILGRPVQTLATIPGGHGVCTTNIPPPVSDTHPPPP